MGVVVKKSNSSIPSHVANNQKIPSSIIDTDKNPKDFNSILIPKDGDNENIDKSNIVRFPTTNSNEPELSLMEVSNLLQKALHNMEEIRSKVSYDSTESNVDYIQRIKEAEDKLMKVQKQFSYFKFYSFVWFFSFVLFSFFALMLFTGIFNSIVAVTGLISSIVGGIGAYLDWRDRERNYD